MKHNWEYKKLGEVVSFIGGGDWIESRHQSDGGIRLIQTGNIGNGVFKAKDEKPHFISESTFEELGCTEIYEGDCLVSRLPDPIGRACIIPNVKNRMITAVDCTILRFQKLIDSNFFVYYTRSKKYNKEIENYTTGSTRKRISRKNLESILIPILPLSEQSRIVAELDLLTGIIDKQNAQLKELDNLAQAIFYDMFGDPIENPKGWDVKKLGDLSTSVSYGTSSPSSTVGKYKYLRMNNITYEGFLDLTDLKYIDMDDAEFEKYSVREGDVLFNRTNSMDLIGKTTYIHDMEPMIIAGYIIRVRLADSVLPVYVSKFMNTPAMKKKMKGMAKGAVNQANINSKELKSIDIPVPPLSLQQSFAEKIQSIEKQKNAIRASIADTQKLLDYTMDKYFG